MQRIDDTTVNSRAQGTLEIIVSRESYTSSPYIAEHPLFRRTEDGRVVESVYMRGLRTGRGRGDVAGLKVGDSIWGAGYREASSVGYSSEIHCSVRLWKMSASADRGREKNLRERR